MYGLWVILIWYKIFMVQDENEKISQFHGITQLLFNIIIQLLSKIFLGWTTIFS